MDEPGAVGELGEGVVEKLGVDRLLDLLKLLDALGPVSAEDLGSELSPGSGCDLVVISGEHAELVEQVSGTSIVAAAVLEVAEVVEGINHVNGDLIRYISKESPTLII